MGGLGRRAMSGLGEGCRSCRLMLIEVVSYKFPVLEMVSWRMVEGRGSTVHEIGNVDEVAMTGVTRGYNSVVWKGPPESIG